MVALYPFKAQSDTELSFNKGDRLEILDRPSSDPEWFKVSSVRWKVRILFCFPRQGIRWDRWAWCPQTISWNSVNFLLKTSGPRMAALSLHLPMVLLDLIRVMGESANWKSLLWFLFSNFRNINTTGVVNEEVRGKPWYFGPISRSDCDVLMAEKGQDGDFLVRDSESTVSFVCVCLAFLNECFNRLGTSPCPWRPPGGTNISEFT